MEEGPFVDGKMHGDWVIRYPNGDVADRVYVDHEMVSERVR